MQVKLLQAAALIIIAASTIVAAANHTAPTHHQCKREWEVVFNTNNSNAVKYKKQIEYTALSTDMLVHYLP
jgi:hypothetical protein